MNYLIVILFIKYLLLGWQLARPKTASVTSEKTTSSSVEREQIQNLIRQALKWSQSKKSIGLLPVLTDKKGGYCVGMDFKIHKLNLEKLKATNFFAAEFINNYNHIILTLDKKIRNKEIEKWHAAGELPPLNFASDVDPWCLCQDVPFDKPNPWDFIKIHIITLDDNKGKAAWKWGKLDSNTGPGWKEFTYGFRVVKENSKWKIAYLQGFDFKHSTSNSGI